MDGSPIDPILARNTSAANLRPTNVPLAELHALDAIVSSLPATLRIFPFNRVILLASRNYISLVPHWPTSSEVKDMEPR